MFGWNYFIESLRNHSCACMGVFVCRTTINYIWVCYFCSRLFISACVYACIYIYMTHFLSLFILLCLFVAVHMRVCLSLWLCMHTGVYASIMASLFPSVCVGGWDFCQHGPFAWSGLNLSRWTQTAVRNTTQCFLSWHPQHTSDYTIMFFFLSSFLHHWCGWASEAPGQIQFLADHGSLSLNLADSINSSK